ncbi:hypothetical protein JXR01_02015 [Candidatus Kaiserbacteria bacterium]|nr:MAG: hypothetical protein JXR01_02015 [Candidatus Kaiserbacteria bacterium]
MKEKKEAKIWYLAALHVVAAGIVIPMLASIVFAIVAVVSSPFLITLTGIDVLAPAVVGYEIVLGVVILAAVFFGARYSIYNMRKYYLVTNLEAVIRFSVIMLVVLASVSFLFDIFFPDPEYVLTSTQAAIEIGQTIILIVVFYLASKMELDKK